jgi:hypothetical protein
MAQGFPGGGSPGGMHGGHGPPPAENGRSRPTPQEASTHSDPFEGLLRAAHELRRSLVLTQAQTERWAQMQDDLRDVVDKRRALEVGPSSSTQVKNLALLFVQDTAVAENALAHSLENLSRSLQTTFDALDDRQKKVFAQEMANALTRDASP